MACSPSAPLARAVTAILLLASIICCCRSAPPGALVTRLPGFDGAKLPSKHYAGYVTVDEHVGSKLFYYLVESERDPARDPVVLWLNGGPGCSSMDGFVYEHGPFNFESGGSSGNLPKLHLNPYSWSKVSSVIYLDSPSGVGLSYSKNVSDYETGDLKTAADSHTFLLKWFQLYPEFQKNPFYIAGESYAGVYIPTLANQVVQGIHKGDNPVINFKGYMVGNGVCDVTFDGNALVPFAHGMGLISDDIYEQTNTACQGNYWNYSYSEKCADAVSNVDMVISGLNIYNILEPCYHGTNTKEVISRRSNNNRMPQSFKDLGVTSRPLPVRTRMFGRAWPLRAPVRDGRVPSWQELAATNNFPSVMCMVSAIGPWILCTDQLLFHHDAGSMIIYHKNLTSQGYRAIIYSGDHDMCVPYTGSLAWTTSLRYGVIDSWRPWFVNGQVSGYTQGYENGLTFATIKGSGHAVPEYKPQEALAFYSRWLAGSKL
ncbi:Serine carboxypeptidase-like 20 [Zea mays]|uniref:Carboxypeptidase n=1 Tax=Zea mays TaxID=4577 RepID=A0A1D6IX23_MAIZE|nr:Serine carboxypeptidase-like 20 [Zea mays]